MASSDEPKSFWTSLPGILTGCAALITAIVGLIGVFHAAPKGTAVPSDSLQAHRPKTDAAPSYHEYLVITRHIDAGAHITSRDIAIERFSDVHDGPSSISELGEARADKPIEQGAVLTWEMLAAQP